MLNNIKNKKLYIGFIFLLFFIILFSAVSHINAAGLEIKYPEIKTPNQAQIKLDSSSKIPDYMVYLFNLGTSIGFAITIISMVIAGIMWFLSPISVEMKTQAKDRMSGSITGFLILLLTYLIITTINPQLSIFKFDDLTADPIPEIQEQKNTGVYFKSGDADEDEQVYNSNVYDLGEIKNQVNNVEIVNGNGVYYMSVLYDNIDSWGKCFWAEEGSTNIDNFADSASVHQYNTTSNSGFGVTFYRNSFFNDEGGYLNISNGEIGDVYFNFLEDLEFENVPEEDKKCTEYNKEGRCQKREEITLGGEEISSVEISGNYVVLFVYFDLQDNISGPWTSCQEFPTKDDINKQGPPQIKWQAIRNDGGVIPNFVIIIPIK